MADIYQNAFLTVEDKAASYTITPNDNGKVFVATAAATFTLPAVADVPSGFNVTVFVGADVAVTITAPSGKLVTFNNAGATSIAFSTASEKAGAGARIILDGTLGKYLALLMTEETQTVTVS